VYYNKNMTFSTLLKKDDVASTLVDSETLDLTTKKGQIKSLDQLLEVSMVDTDVWEVERYVANVWNCFSSIHGMQDLWQVKATLKKKISVADWQVTLEQAVKEVRKAFKQSIPIPKTKEGMVEYSIPDLHLGKLCWGGQTGGRNYDVRTAVSNFKEALLDLAANSSNTDEAWLPIGNDFFNVDNESVTTTNGTPQDEDGRPQKTFSKGLQLVVWAVEILKKKHKRVQIIIVPGNHDETRAFFLGSTLQAWYRSDKRVTVDNEPNLRKYKLFGQTLIGYCHGDRIKKLNLLTIMQAEARKLWGRTKYAEFHCGHFHHEHTIDEGGLIIRYLPSLTPPDRYHSKAGYTSSQQSAVAFEYGKTLKRINYFRL
jgi:hypothetical protein